MLQSTYTTILSDFSRVIIKPKDKNYSGALNPIHRELTEKFGQSYNLFDHFEINDRLLDFYKSLKANYSINLFTTDIIQNHPQIRPELEGVFENIFAANDLGLNKKEPAAYLFLCKKMDVRPASVIYIDDQLGNIEAAKAAGEKDKDQFTLLKKEHDELTEKVTEQVKAIADAKLKQFVSELESEKLCSPAMKQYVELLFGEDKKVYSIENKDGKKEDLSKEEVFKTLLKLHSKASEVNLDESSEEGESGGDIDAQDAKIKKYAKEFPR